MEAGQRSNQIGFVLTGVFKIFFFDRKGNDITRYFVAEDQFLVDLQSFNNEIRSGECIQALTDAEIAILHKSTFKRLIQEVEGFNAVVEKITSEALLEKLYNRSELLNKDAKERYLHFMEKHPNLINRIPLGNLSSYLGITQPSLSRIRKEIATKVRF
ncbi:MAG: Crp/Fnr family transcriptional regulator [Bacteroidota bacterium]